MDQEINIHYDFTDGTEMPYGVAKNCTTAFNTHCLDFFSTDHINATIKRKDGRSISVKELLANDGRFTKKEIRKAHNIRKMLVAGAFGWSAI